MQIKRPLLIALMFTLCHNSLADLKPILRIGTQATGTLSWELAVLKTQANTLDFAIELMPMANAEASKIALQSGAVDMIVSDWLWVSRSRASGQDFTFYPYSSASGALVVSANSPIKTLDDLNGKRLGIVGGELDKNWLLLQEVAQREHIDLSNTEKLFGAPPLLTEQLKQGRLDAVLTYWHFASDLKSQGYVVVLDGQQILQHLGFNAPLANIGYVFRENWAKQHIALLNSFFKASTQAKTQLCENDPLWQQQIAQLHSHTSGDHIAVRQGYCTGIITQWGDKQQHDIAQLYSLLDHLSNHQLTGSATLQPGTLWTMP